MKLNDKHLSYIGSSANIPIDKQGWLSKKGELNTSYQRRWCILKGNLLFYYEKPGLDRDPIGVIVLEGCCVQLAEGGDSPYTFSILFPGEGTRVYKLTADDDAACNAWVKSLTNSSYQYLEILVEGLEKEVKSLTRNTEMVTINFPSDESTPTASTSSLSSNELHRNCLPLERNNASNPEISFLKDPFLSNNLHVKSNSNDTLTDTSDNDDAENDLLQFDIHHYESKSRKSENLRRSKSTDALSTKSTIHASSTYSKLKNKNSPKLAKSKFGKFSPKPRRKKDQNLMKFKVYERGVFENQTCMFNNFLELHSMYKKELQIIIQQQEED